MTMKAALRRWLSPGDAASAVPAWAPSAAPHAWTDAPDAPSALHWRAPWQACLPASWLMATAMAPSFWLVGTLLAIDARSDHPAFWFSLPGIVALVNAVSIARINQRQHRQPYACRETLALHYRSMSRHLGSALFLAVGWGSGFLPDITWPAAHGPATLAAIANALLWNLLLAWFFGWLSFAHAGGVHARIGFVYPERGPRA